MRDRAPLSEVDTIDSASERPLDVPPRVPGLTLALHPDAARIGERAPLFPLLLSEQVEISRFTPSFLDASAVPSGPIGVAHVSRSPLILRHREGRFRLDPTSVRSLVVNGASAERPIDLSPQALERGVIIELGRRVVLLLHWMGPRSAAASPHGLIGPSDSLHDARRAVERAAEHDQPVLVTGPSGSGKELIARAIHEASHRRGRPYVAVNMATLLPTTAPSELFGHTKGAFTGAGDSHGGLFGRAHTGTLFLDEIAEADASIQSMLLRALETMEVTPVGGRDARAVDVRVIAATDRRLHEAMAAGSFREPLYHRLTADVIELQPLAERRDDIVPLFHHFVAEADPDGAPRSLGAVETRHLLEHPWPGNVRELRNLARWYARLDPAERKAGVIEGRLGPARALAVPAGPGVGFDDEALIRALREHRFNVERTARALGVSKNHLYKRMELCASVRKARDVGEEEIRTAQSRCGGSLGALAAMLEVSERGLQLRMRELGLLS